MRARPFAVFGPDDRLPCSLQRPLARACARHGFPVVRVYLAMKLAPETFRRFAKRQKRWLDQVPWEATEQGCGAEHHQKRFLPSIKVHDARYVREIWTPILSCFLRYAVNAEIASSPRRRQARRDRPELARALDYMRKGDVLVLWKLDRLARSMKQLIETIELLDGEGIGFQSVTEAMDTTPPGGRLLFHICGALAEFARGIIRERTAAGLKAARAQGRTGGAKRKLDETAKREARALLAIPESTVKSVAERFGVSVATLYREIPKARSANP